MLFSLMLLHLGTEWNRVRTTCVWDYRVCIENKIDVSRGRKGNRIAEDSQEQQHILTLRFFLLHMIQAPCALRSWYSAFSCSVIVRFGPVLRRRPSLAVQTTVMSSQSLGDLLRRGTLATALDVSTLDLAIAATGRIDSSLSSRDSSSPGVHSGDVWDRGEELV